MQNFTLSHLGIASLLEGRVSDSLRVRVGNGVDASLEVLRMLRLRVSHGLLGAGVATRTDALTLM